MSTFETNSEPETVDDELQAWLARFAPLVQEESHLPAEALRERLDLLQRLEQEARELRMRLGDLPEVDPEVSTVFTNAVDQLPALETDLRRQLGAVAPGDPEGIADIEELKDRLAERAARSELGLGWEVPAILEEDSSPGQPGQGAMMALFGFGMLSFTLVHAAFMIGGMKQTFGALAFGLLAFYAIFWSVSLVMILGAWRTAARESIVLEGRRLTVRRRLGPISTTKRLMIKPGTGAAIRSVEFMGMSQQQNPKLVPAVEMIREDGRTIHVAAGNTPEAKAQLRDRINAYLRVHGRD